MLSHVFTCFHLQVVTRDPCFRVLHRALQQTVRDGNRMRGKDVLQKVALLPWQSWQIAGTYDESKLLLLESVGDGLAAASFMSLIICSQRGFYWNDHSSRVDGPVDRPAQVAHISASFVAGLASACVQLPSGWER